MADENANVEVPAGTPPAESITSDRSLSDERFVKTPTKPQPMPDHAPLAGTRYVLDPKTGLYNVERIPDAEPKPAELIIPEEQKDENQEAVHGVELPDTLPDYIRENPETQTLVSEGAAAMKLGGEYTDEQVQRTVDLIAQFELEIGAEQPPLFEEDRIRAMLKARWGEGYQGRLELVNRYVNARPALKAYLNRTGAGNQLSVLEALGMIATGVMALTPAEAAERMDSMRRDPKSPLCDPYHKQHKVVVQQAKVWADIIDRGEKKAAKKDGGKSELATLQRKQEALDARREKAPVDEATQKLDEQIRAIRLDKGYADASAANHKQLVAEMQRLMR